MALRYCRDNRALSLRGSITLTDGAEYPLGADNIVRYTVDESSTGGEAITIGDTRAAEYHLEIADTAHTLTAAALLGARVSVDIGLDGVFDPLGVWTISKARISRQSATVDISGADALSDKADVLYTDGTYPATLGQIIQRAADQAGLTLKNTVFRNSGVTVAAKPEWDPETNSVRAVIGYVAGCAGGFARIDRAGLLEIVPYNTQTAGEVGADYFATLNVGMGRSFEFNCLQVMHYGTNIYTRYAINSAAEDTAGNTLRISDNPLMTANIAQSLVSALTGMSGQAISADWVGDPTVQTGAVLTFADTDGKRYPGIITGQTIEIDGGLHMTTDADLPETISATYATDTLYTPSGKVNITAIEGRLKVWAENEIDVAVGGIEIGGTNLIRDTGWYTECAPGWATEGNAVLKYPYDLYPGQDDFFTEGYIFFGTTDVASGIWVPRIQVKAGETYTLSFRMRGTYLNAIWAGFDANDALVWSEQRRYEEYLTTDVSYTMTIPAGVTSIHIVFRSTAQYASVLGRIKLERGNKATSWSPHPLDNARGVVNGSALNITKDGVIINTPVLDINASGADGDAHFGASGFAVNKVNSPSVHARYDGPTTLYVNGTPDGVTNFATLTDAFAKLNGKQLPGQILIYYNQSTTESVLIEYISGGNVTVFGNGTLTGNITLRHMTSRFDLCYFTITSPAGVNCIFAENCRDLHVISCTLNADSYNNGQYMACINATNTAAWITNTSMWHSFAAAFADSNAQVFLESCKGNYNTFAVYCRNNSTVGIVTSRPSGDNGIYCAGDSVVRGATDAYDAGSGVVPPTPPATTTVTLTATNSRTYGGGWYSGTNVLSQGVSGGTTFYGLMWFDLSAIAGKTIKSASIRLYRRAGVGRGVPVEVYVGTHNASGPSGGTNLVNAYGSHLVGVVDQKDVLSASVATAAVQELANGTAKGLYTHSNAGGYAQFDGYDGGRPPQLTVTYQ